MSSKPILDSTHLPSDIESVKAADVFQSQRYDLTKLLQHDLPNIASMLYTKSIISAAALAEAMNQVHIASVRTVSLLSVVEDKIRAEPHVFTEFVKILESEPTLRSQASELVKRYIKGSFVNPETRTPSATSSAISRYGDYLEGVYSRSSVSSDGKFPPTPSKTYVNLALVKRASEVRDLKEVREHTLHGRVDEMLKRKRRIYLADILKPQRNGSPVSLVFVEGPPGVGKSTLAWELCRRWDRKQYDLAVLLRLRESEVQQIESIADLFPHFDKDICQSVAKEVLDRDGKRVLFILDGYDELPLKLRRQGLLLKLLKGVGLPNSSVLVTSRPSATSDLLMACSPQIQRHVEILGFTQECVKDYASSVLSSEPEMLKDFLTYISASQNPAINSLMYIPLNAAIIVHIYKNSRRKGCPIPKTLTQVYTQLCLTLIQRYSMSNDSQERTILNEFSDLPSMYYANFKQLAQLAYEQFEKHKVVFCSLDVHRELVHFGFLDSVSSLYGGGGVSYNFLHLTFQEFLAAYHITQLPNGIDVFRCHSEDERWEVVWRFVSGLTGFKYFMNSVRCDAFVSVRKGDKYFELKHLLLHCLFEGQFSLNFRAVLGTNSCYSSQYRTSPLDSYALGHCISNCSYATLWKVRMIDISGKSFMWGLNSDNCGNGAISHLKMSRVSPTCLDSYPRSILSGINYLRIDDSDLDPNILVQVLPLMKNLTLLRIEIANSFHVKISDSSTKFLCDNLFGPSSLNQLALELPYFTENSFDLLETNTCLINVRISSVVTLPSQPLSKILQKNKTMERLRWGWLCLDLSKEEIEALNVALSSNTTLKELTFDSLLSCEYLCQTLSSIMHDPRVKLLSSDSDS